MDLPTSSTTPVIIKSESGEEVVFDSKFIDLSDLAKNAPVRTEPLITDISTELLNWVKVFCEKHSYSAASMTYTFPTVVNNPRGNLSEISYELLSGFYVEGNISESAKRVAPYLTVADKLQFRKLYTTLNIFLIAPLHIDETDNAVKEFMDNFNLKEDEDFSAEKINKAIAENKELFELVVTRFSDNVAALDEIQGVTE